jgi:hypothetical protein
MATLLDIINRLPKPARDKLVTTAKRAFDIGWEEHSNKLVALRLIAHAKQLPVGRTKTRLNELGVFVAAHPEMCYPDLRDYFNNVKGWYPDEDLRQEIINSFPLGNFTRKLVRKHLEDHYPNLEDTKW